MDQRVKLQISSDLEDVTKVSSVLLEEALLHVRDLASLITAGKELLREIDISNPNDIEKLKKSLELIASTKQPVVKIDNRLSDIVAIVDGLGRVLTGQSPSPDRKEESDDNVPTG